MRAAILAVTLLATSCAVQPSRQGAAARVRAPLMQAERLPIFPFWTAAQMPSGPPADGVAVPEPVAAAVLIAPGFLIAPRRAMGNVAVDMSRPATVHLHDGRRWYRGTFVDADLRSPLVLIAASVAGRPLRLAAGTTHAYLVGIVRGSPNGRRPLLLRSSGCGLLERRAHGILQGLAVSLGIEEPKFCASGGKEFQDGVALLDAAGMLVGFAARLDGTAWLLGHRGNHEQVAVVAEREGLPLVGWHADIVRSFVADYAGSWGKRHPPKFLE